eukprot:Gb_29124 [translate_table: standard]
MDSHCWPFVYALVPLVIIGLRGFFRKVTGSFALRSISLESEVSDACSVLSVEISSLLRSEAVGLPSLTREDDWQLVLWIRFPVIQVNEFSLPQSDPLVDTYGIPLESLWIVESFIRSYVMFDNVWLPHMRSRDGTASG